MGMFDEIRCKLPLPDGYADADAVFQTKSIPNPCLFKYTITEQGRLLDEWGNDCEPDGYIRFYTVDPVGQGEAEDQPDAGWRDYRARFCAGALQSIVRLPIGWREEERNQHFGLASFRWFAPPKRLEIDLKLRT